MIKILAKEKELELIAQTTYYVRDKKADIDMLTTSDLKEARHAYKFCRGRMEAMREWRKLNTELKAKVKP